MTGTMIGLLNDFATAIVAGAGTLLTGAFGQIAVAVVAVGAIAWVANKILLKKS